MKLIYIFSQIGASALTDKTIEVPTSGVEKGIVPIYICSI